MDFIDQIEAIAARIPKQIEHIKTEEATKTAFIMPFIQALGYNVFDPTEVVPEYTADVGIKKGEKVDYAIKLDGKPIMLFECKSCTASLDAQHESQLHRYFHATHARIGVLTNGVVYEFFTDLEEPNKMDLRPFLVFDMLDIKEHHVGELKRLSRSGFDLDRLLSAAEVLKYTRALKKAIAAELADPSEDFVRYFAKQVYDGNLTPKKKEQFTDITKRAFNQFVSEQLNARLKSALGEGSPEVFDSTTEEAPVAEEADAAEAPCGKEGIETTQEELDGFAIVRAIVCEVVDVDRVVMRDTKSYCGILLDDNNRKPICRLRFNSPTKKYLALIDADKNEDKVPVVRPEDIYQHAERLRETVRRYEEM